MTQTAVSVVDTDLNVTLTFRNKVCFGSNSSSFVFGIALFLS